MKKLALSLLAASLVVTTGFALDIAAAQGKVAVNAEKAPQGNVNMQNTKLENKSNITGSAVAGNTGIQLKGKNINVKNTTIKSNSNIKNSAVAGNSGVAIKAKNMNLKNVKIQNDSNIKGSAVAGNTGVAVGN